jgi:hypothetical protein
MKNRFVAGPRALAYSLAVTSLLTASSALAAPHAVSNARAADLTETARSLPRGASLRIEGTTLDETSGIAGLDLVRFEPAAPGAKFIAQSASGPRELHPDVPVYYRGSVDGMRGSIVVLGFRSNGEIRGIVTSTDGTWVIGREHGRPDELRSKKVKKSANDPEANFTCSQVESTGPRRSRPAAVSGSAALNGSASPAGTASLTETRISRLPIVYTAQIAVELDYDFYQLFNDENEAVLYALDLMAFTGSLGESELGMNVQVPYLILWTDPADPYSGGELNRLNQLRDRWNQPGETSCGGIDCTTIPRSTTIVLSAAGSGGVAYIPALCDWYHSPTNGYSYASAGSMDGNFDIESPSVVWDVVVVTHELGHNLGSPHTHCYDPPVDGCYAGETGCYSGATSLPSGCPGNGQGCGTIMGYCHRLTGGLSNVSLTFGAGHPYGDTPQRVPDTIIDQLDLEATYAPACLTATDGMVELDVTKNGTGSGTVTASSGALDCGPICHTYIDANESVTLTATPTAFSEFAGWTGDADCNDGVITAATATSCIATFNGSCGVLQQDCEDDNPCTTDSCPGDVACVNSAAPRDESSCFTSPLTRFKLTHDDDPARSKLQWQWLKGDAYGQADLGNPALTTDYALCVYDMNASVPSLATALALPAGTPGWSDRSPDGWKFAEKEGIYDGYRKMDLRTGIAGKSRVKLKAGGAALPLPGPVGAEYFNQDPSVVVQLLASDGSCWTSEFPVGSTSRNSASSFNATGN